MTYFPYRIAWIGGNIAIMILIIAIMIIAMVSGVKFLGAVKKTYKITKQTHFKEYLRRVRDF